MSDDWVYLGSYKDHTQYYRKSSVIIDEEKNTINVLVKSIAKTKEILYIHKMFIVLKNQITINVNNRINGMYLITKSGNLL